MFAFGGYSNLSPVPTEDAEVEGDAKPLLYSYGGGKKVMKGKKGKKGIKTTVASTTGGNIFEYAGPSGDMPADVQEQMVEETLVVDAVQVPAASEIWYTLKEAATPLPLSAPSPSPLSFKTLRQNIIRDIHINVMKGGKFSDAELLLYTRRTKSGTPYQSEVLSVNKTLLSAASSEFEKQIFGTSVDVCSDGYAGDSDLEEDGEVMSESEGGNDGSSSQTLTQPSSFLTKRASVNYDFDSLSDEDEGYKAPRRSLRQSISLGEKTLQDGALRTWQAMVLYLYSSDDQVTFKPLQSSSVNQRSTSDVWACSPKSMYRLAHKFKLRELEGRAMESIKRDLSAENIVQELFSDFTWRYPDILQMELEILSQHSRNAAVDHALRAVFDGIAAGELPRCSVVLKSLFASLINQGGTFMPFEASPSISPLLRPSIADAADPLFEQAAQTPTYGTCGSIARAGWGHSTFGQ